MKVSELIELLKRYDPGKEVMIQQGEEFDYMVVYTVREKDVYDGDFEEDEPKSVVVIEYC